MSQGKPRDPRKEQFWRRMLRQWQRSGLSVRAFCEQHDLSQPSFYAWRRTLAERDAQAVAFVPVEVLSDTLTLSPSEAAAGGLELVLAGGRVLRIGPAFDAPTLRRLLAALEEGRP
jgi:transposase-like protein